jgi:hypothetical protein
MNDVVKVVNHARRKDCAVLLLLLLFCVFVSACERRGAAPKQQSGGKPLLIAEPNPIPAGDPDNPVASTQIKWDTGDGRPGDLCVKIDREEERLIGRAPSGVMKIDWIQFDSVYEFRLYSKKRSRLLATLTVTRDD